MSRGLQRNDGQESGKRTADVLFCALAAILCFARFRLGLQPLLTYDDDFFYYLRAALNLVHTGHSTFDGVHLTNGYHPLWFLVITALCKVVPVKSFFFTLQCVEFGLSLSTYACLKRLFLRYTRQAAYATGSAVLVATLAATLSRNGMEIGLFFPCIAAALAWRLRPNFRWTVPQSALYGFLLSLAVLARLDSAILIALLLLAELDWRVFRLPMRLGACFSFSGGAGLFPLYLLSNRWWFHTWLPVSGQAKQLRLHPYVFTVRQLRSVFITTSPFLMGLVWGGIALIAVSLWCSRSSPALTVSRRFELALFLFPWLHLLTLSLRSDWVLWPWYLYPFVLVYAASALVLLPQANSPQHAVFLRRSWLLYAPLFALVAQSIRISPAAERLYQANLELARFMRQHPGVYAMGDRSGMLSVMTDQPMLQVEGLMEDTAFVAAIRQQQPLRQVLQRYGATYYIAGVQPGVSRCASVQEPVQAGSNSPHMHALLCAADGLLPPPLDHGQQVYAVGSVLLQPTDR